MVLWAAMLWFAIAGCGRYGFDAVAGDGGGAVIPPAPSTPFTRVWSGDDFEVVRGVVVLPEGDLVVAGVITQPTHFGGGVLLGADGDSSLFAARLSGTGEHRWSWSLVTDGIADGGRLALADGRILLAGYVSGTGEVRGTTIGADSGQDAIVLEIDGAGGIDDVAVFGGPSGNTQVYGLGTSASGQRAIAGLYASGFTVDEAVMPAPAAGDDGFGLVLDAAGAGSIGVGFAGGGTVYARAAAFDGAGDVMFGGRFESTLTVGSVVAMAAGGSDGFGVILAPDGSVRKLLTASTGGADRVEDVIGVPAGGFVMCGMANGTLFDDGVPLITAGVDVIVVRVDPDGAIVWMRALGGDGAEENCRLALHGDRLYVGALFRETVVAGPDSLVSAGGLDLGFVAYDLADGTPLRGWRAGGSGDEGIEVLVVDPGSGDLIVAGAFTGTTQLGAVTATAVGTTDAYVYRFAPE